MIIQANVKKIQLCLRKEIDICESISSLPKTVSVVINWVMKLINVNKVVKVKSARACCSQPIHFDLRCLRMFIITF